MFAIKELIATLVDAWAGADLCGRLREWWWVVTHQALLEKAT